MIMALSWPDLRYPAGVVRVMVMKMRLNESLGNFLTVEKDGGSTTEQLLHLDLRKIYFLL